jgi:CubicO group peptidase (beta-lactamase class C family)
VIWDYHYLAPERGPNGTNKSNGDSQYMIASISKVFTDLVLLKNNISLEDPITKYLPELQTRGADPPTAYEEITVGMLGDHLSGMVQNCMLAES